MTSALFDRILKRKMKTSRVSLTRTPERARPGTRINALQTSLKALLPELRPTIQYYRKSSADQDNVDLQDVVDRAKANGDTLRARRDGTRNSKTPGRATRTASGVHWVEPEISNNGDVYALRNGNYPADSYEALDYENESSRTKSP